MGRAVQQVEISTLIARTLVRLGAKVCFGVAGSTNYKVTAALEREGVRYIAARHECNAVAMADAYSRSSGELTLVSVHAGPGLTNAITGIAEASKSGTPLLVLSGDVANGDFRSNFHIDQAALARSVGAVAERIYSAATALDDTVRACSTALRDRSTVVLSLPMDVQAQMDQERPVPYDAMLGPIVSVPLAADIQKLADMLLAAKKPLILAGRGAVLSAAGCALAQLGEEAGALLATSACGHGLFRDDPWSLGISGGFSSPVAVDLIKQSDLLLGFGVSFTHWTTRGGRLLAPGATVVQIDIDSSRLAYNQPVDFGFVGDAAATAAALHQEIKARLGLAGSNRGWRNDETKRLLLNGRAKDRPLFESPSDRHIDPRTLSQELDRLLPADRLVATDGGHFMGWAAEYISVPDEKGWSFAMSFSSTGLGLGTAIGASLAQPGRLAVLCAGDGGFMMSVPELETAVRLKMRLCIVIYNDSSYAAEVHEFGPMGYPTSIAEFPDIDFAVMARGYGAQGIVVRTLSDLGGLRAWLEAGAEGVFLVDAKVDPSVKADWFLDLLEQKRH